MPKRYLDINSAYRNRLTYPSVSNFVVQLNSNNASSSSTAQQPVLLAFPFETNLLQGGSTFTQIVLSVNASPVTNFYRGKWIEINGYYRQVTSYDGTLKIATVGIPFPVAYPALTLYTVRFELPSIRDFTGAISPALNKIVLNAGASSIKDFYVNQWIFVPGLTPPSTYQWFRITAYDGTTKVATIAGNFSSLVPAGAVFEIMTYNYDNVKPLKYFGTEVGTGQPRCSNISLVNLIVPNFPILNGYGGTLQNYPFLYFCIYSEKGITYNNPIISNEPASDKALFKVPVTYLQNNTFLTLGYSGMTQNVSFRVNDDLRIQILLPTGEPLEFDTGNPTFFPDHFPIPSNPFTQLQAVIEVSD
jgi:hypothetical protein